MITAVVPTSPIPSHPDTAILEETLNSIRHHLPDAEIILTFDGVRPEQNDMRTAYEEYIRRALWRADHHYGNVAPFISDEHLHQTGMLRGVFGEIRTPLLMYVEADTPLVTDEPIDFAAITSFIESGTSNLVRLHHEAVIPAEHEHMMHGRDRGGPVKRSFGGAIVRTFGAEFIRTSQWSQRPHVASTAYYRRILDAHFSPDTCSFIEDRMHGIVAEAFNVDGMAGWNQHRLHIYAPPGNMKRSYHLDGRAGGAKYDETQVW